MKMYRFWLQKIPVAYKRINFISMKCQILCRKNGCTVLSSDDNTIYIIRRPHIVSYYCCCSVAMIHVVYPLFNFSALLLSIQCMILPKIRGMDSYLFPQNRYVPIRCISVCPAALQARSILSTPSFSIYSKENGLSNQEKIHSFLVELPL